MKRTPTHSAAASLLTSPPYQLPPPANLPEHLGLLRQEAYRPVPGGATWRRCWTGCCPHRSGGSKVAEPAKVVEEQARQ